MFYFSDIRTYLPDSTTVLISVNLSFHKQIETFKAGFQCHCISTARKTLIRITYCFIYHYGHWLFIQILSQVCIFLVHHIFLLGSSEANTCSNLLQIIVGFYLNPVSNVLNESRWNVVNYLFQDTISRQFLRNNFIHLSVQLFLNCKDYNASCHLHRFTLANEWQKPYRAFP